MSSSAIHRSIRWYLIAALLVLGLAGTAAIGTVAAVATTAVKVKLTGENHHPLVNKSWTYSITVTADGKKLSGTETTHYLYGSSVVGTEKPVNVRFKNGYFRDTITFPADAAGQPLTLQVVVHTKNGSASATWAITVKQ